MGTLPDGSIYDDAEIVAGPLPDHPAAEGIEETNWFVTDRNPAGRAEAWVPMSCPPPSHWAADAERLVRGTTFYPVSPFYGPSQTDTTWTRETTLSVTKGTDIKGGIGWSISVLEAQAQVKLENSITTKIAESVTFKVEKGRRYVIHAQFIYRETTLVRTAHGGSNCRPESQRLTVLTPYDVAYLVGLAPV